MNSKLLYFLAALVIVQLAVSFVYSSRILYENQTFNHNQTLHHDLQITVQDLQNQLSFKTSLATIASAASELKPMTHVLDLR